MDYLPVNISIRDKKILIIGGGKVALQKIKTLVKFTKKIEVVSPEILDEILKFDIAVKRKKYVPNDIHGATLVFAATDNKTINESIARYCKSISVLVNVVDNPALSDFTSMAIHLHKNMTVAVGSGAKSPKESVRLRDKIAVFLTKFARNK